MQQPMNRRVFLGGIAAMCAGSAMARPTPSMPLWRKRVAPLFPPLSSNETDIIVFNGRLIAATFNRPPLAQEVIFRDITDRANPILIARRPCPMAMGGVLVDPATNILHMYGCNPPAQDTSPWNSLIHVPVNSDWTLGTPNTILGPSGMGFNNVGVTVLPGGGFALTVGQDWGNGMMANSFSTASHVDFSDISPKSAFYYPTPKYTGQLPSPIVDLVGVRTMRPVGTDGWIYVTSDSINSYTRICRTRDFITFKFETDAYAFMGIDFEQGAPVIGGAPFQDGNVSWIEFPDKYGNPSVVAIYFISNETNYGAVYDAEYQGSADSLVAQFHFES